MGNLISNAVKYITTGVQEARYDLIKAGILEQSNQAFHPKASLVDPMGYQSLTAFGYKERYSVLDYYKLKQIAFADPIIAAIIQTRSNQVAAFGIQQPDKFKAGYKVMLKDKDKEPSKAEKARAKEIEEFILNCGVPETYTDTPERKRRETLGTFLRKICRDTLTYDQVNFEITPRRNGMPYSFNAVDPATIRLVPDIKEKMETFQGGDDRDYDFLRVMPYQGHDKGKERETKTPRYVQVINGIVRHTFDEEEMCFGVRNPRTDIFANGYGFSEIEMMVTIITSHMNAETYNRKFFSQGSSTKGMIAFEGSVPRDQLEAFRRQWHQQVAGVNNAWKTPILAMDKDTKINYVDLQKSNKEMEFGKWLEYCIKVICGIFQIDPVEIGFDISKMGSSGQSNSGGGLGEGNPVQRIIESQDKGLKPLLKFIETLFNDYIVCRIDPNFEFCFVGLNAKSEKDDLDQAEKEAKTYKTINEIRAEHDRDPVKSFGQIDTFGDLILDSNVINAWSQVKSMEQQQEMGMDGQGDQGQDQQQGQNQEDGFPPEVQEDQDGNIPQGADYDDMSLKDLEARLKQVQGGGPGAAAGGGNGQAQKSLTRVLRL